MKVARQCHVRGSCTRERHPWSLRVYLGGKATLISDALLELLELLELLSITDLSFAIGDELHQSLATFAGTNRINEPNESGC